MKRLLYIIALACLFAGCRNIRQVAVVQHDTIFVSSVDVRHVHDSVFIHDSVFVHEYTKGDTVFIEKWRQRLHNIWHCDTLRLTDTCYIAREQQQQVVVESSGEKWRLVVFALSILLLAIVCLNVVNKLK